MGGAIAGSAIGGLFSAAGDLGSAAISREQRTKSIVSAPSLNTSASLQALEFFNLLNLGVFDPSSLFQASPFSQTLANLASSGGQAVDTQQQMREALEDGLREYRRLVDKFGGWENVPIEKRGKVLAIASQDIQMGAILNNANYPDPFSFFQAQLDFEDQLPAIFEQVQGLASENLATRTDAQRQINTLLGDLPDVSAEAISGLQAQEKERLLRDLNLSVDEQRGDLLSLANFGNFNPGRALGDLEEFRARSTQDADLDAMNRALAIIGGQQGAAANQLGILQGGLGFPEDRSLQIASFDLGQGGGFVSRGQATSNPLGPAVAGAGNALGNAAFTIGLLADERARLAALEPGPTVSQLIREQIPT